MSSISISFLIKWMFFFSGLIFNRSQYINYNHLDQQNSHGQPSQAHDLYVHGNNTAANAGIADPQYHTHSHMHRKYKCIEKKRKKSVSLSEKISKVDEITIIRQAISFHLTALNRT